MQPKITLTSERLVAVGVGGGGGPSILEKSSKSNGSKGKSPSISSSSDGTGGLGIFGGVDFTTGIILYSPASSFSTFSFILILVLSSVNHPSELTF